MIGKATLNIISLDVQKVAESLELCSGQLRGVEAVVHAMGFIFGDSNIQQVVLIDAENAFNNLNQHTALINIVRFCSTFAHILIDTGVSLIFSLEER